MNHRRVILGSNSPRRSEILSQVGIAFEIIPSRKEETTTKKKPSDIVMELSLQKAMDVLEQIERKVGYEDVVIICADTMVAYKKHVLGKPKNEKDAYYMLDMIQNKKHDVYTGVSMISLKDGKRETQTFFSDTKVYMNPMTNQEILDYILTGECNDKAGSYAIQGYGARYIRKIVGDYYNVMGLPVEKVYNKLMEDFR